MKKNYMLGLFLIFNFIFNCENNKIKNNKGKIVNKMITFKDQLGKTIKLKEKAKKIISIPMSGAVISIGIDGNSRKIKGMHPITKQATLKGIFGDFFPELKNVVTDIVKGSALNIEELLKINPDLIFQWAMKTFHKGIDKMEKLGLTVAAFDWNTKKDMTAGWIKMVGHGIGKLDKTQKLLDWRKQKLQFFKNISLKIPNKDRLRTLYFKNYKNKFQVQEFYTMRYAFKMNNPSRIKRYDIDWRPKTVDIEQIIEWDPEIILIKAYEKDVNPKNVYENELLNEISAIKNRRVYKMPFTGHGASQGGDGSHEDPLTWMWMAMILYPDYFNFDLRKEIKTWYKMMYSKIPTYSQINFLLRININKKSKNYERFM